MIRPVRRDDKEIVCHLVREVRDSGRTRLDYTDGVAVITFARDRRPGTAPGAGIMSVTPNLAAIPQREHETVLTLLGTLREQFERNCRYLTGDKIRGMLRAYIESLMAIRVRPTGGVYFVHSRQAAVLESLRILIGRFGAGSSLYRVPLPDQDEMREMVIEAWRSEQRAALHKLSIEIAEAQAAANSGSQERRRRAAPRQVPAPARAGRARPPTRRRPGGDDRRDEPRRHPASGPVFFFFFFYGATRLAGAANRNRNKGDIEDTTRRR